MHPNRRRTLTVASLLATALLALAPLHAHAQASPPVRLTLMSAGAFKQVVLGRLADFQSRTGIQVDLVGDTAGGLLKRIEGGQTFDLVVITLDGVRKLAQAGAVDAASVTPVAKAGIGVGVRAGAAKPALATVDQFKQAVREAGKVAYVDPASGGSSGIYLHRLFGELGMASEVAAKAVLVQGGLAADRVANGQADMALQQVSEILPVKGVQLAGMLPEAIQSYTTYGAGISTRSAHADAARALLQALTGDEAAELIRGLGMQPAK